MVLLLLLDKANLPQESSSSLTLLMPMREGSVPLLQLNSPALGWLLLFKPFSWQICQGRWDFWQSCCYQKCATVSFCLFFFFLFVLLNPLVFAKPLWFIAHKKTSCIRQEQWVAVFWCLWLGPWATWPMAAAAMVTVLWGIAEALGPGFSFTSSVTAGWSGEVKMRRTLMDMKILRRQRIPVVPNMFSLQSCGIASQGVSFHYFQS